MSENNQAAAKKEVILIGGGIMSSTLGVFLNQLQPDWNITVYERLDKVAMESSSAWNNAGTGHAGNLEMNYTPYKDGKVDVSKALKVAEQFELSTQFWSYLVEKGILKNNQFVSFCPHHAVVFDEEDVEFLKKRYEAMHVNPLFETMTYTEDKEVMKEWFPLIMEGRDENQAMASTRVNLGTDVDYGTLTHLLFDYLADNGSATLNYRHDVKSIKRASNGKWTVKVKDLASGQTKKVEADFVFIGAGGHSLPLLLKTGIPESKGFGGFPVSGQFLICKNEEIIKKHTVKAYGKAKLGAPPMSVPHLDSRTIEGKEELLFGPFAGFSTNFLKEGSKMDLINSIKCSNMFPMMQAGLANMDLTKYLIQQVKLKQPERVEALREFYPNAKDEDWELRVAGQRVQIIKKGPNGKGILQFGTELVKSADGSLSALLGASPGASTAVAIMVDLITKCFPEQVKNNGWEAKMKEMIPSFGISLNDNPELLRKIRANAAEKLEIGG